MIQKLNPNATVPHAYQDEKYGINTRVLNPIKPVAGQPPKYRDTVTGKIVEKSDFAK